MLTEKEIYDLIEEEVREMIFWGRPKDKLPSPEEDYKKRDTMLVYRTMHQERLFAYCKILGINAETAYRIYKNKIEQQKSSR